MDRYIYTEKFTLIPKEFYTPEQGREALMAQFSLYGDAPVLSYELEDEGAVVVYSAPLHQAEGEHLPPFVVKLIRHAKAVEEFNKVVLHYSVQRGISHTIIYAGEELKLVNSFKVDSFESALYFLFLSIKGLQMNPQQCVVNVCWTIPQQSIDIVSRFFKGVEVTDLDIHII